MKRLLPLVLVVAVGACTSGARNACNKARECCSTMSICEDINKTGPNWEERCEIETQASIDVLGTYNSEACSKIASTSSQLLDCLGSVACADISTDPRNGHVSKCDPQAKAYCNALQSSGDACGHDWGNISCDNYIASLALE